MRELEWRCTFGPVHRALTTLLSELRECSRSSPVCRAVGLTQHCHEAVFTAAKPYDDALRRSIARRGDASLTHVENSGRSPQRGSYGPQK